MHIDLSDILRCPVNHEETSLVVTVHRKEGRHLIDGILGCPVCSAQYPVRNGIADLRAPGEARSFVEAAPAPVRPVRPDEARVFRAAALLDLGDAGRVVAIVGASCDVAVPLGELAQVHVIAIDPVTPLEDAEHVSVLRLGAGLPFAPASLDGAIVDARAVERWGFDAILAHVKARGRVVAPAGTPVPDEIALLARDELEWVGERRPPASAPVKLRLAR